MSFTKVNEVTAGNLEIQQSQSPILRITAEGTVPNGGWTDPQLEQYIYVKFPLDGIWDFDFVAQEPDGPVPEVITTITAHYEWQNFPSELKGVRIHSSTNELVLKI